MRMIGKTTRVCSFFFEVFFSLLVALTNCIVPAYAENSLNENDLPSDLTEIGIKNLLDFDLVVTSPGKKEQPVSEVASAVYVLTGDDMIYAGWVSHMLQKRLEQCRELP